MLTEKSAGAVIFTQHYFPEKLSKQKQHTKNGAGLRKEKSIIKYLLLHYPRGMRTSNPYWDFPKGHIEKGEKLEEAARREIFEETGIKNIEFIKGFKEWIKYFFKQDGKNISKIVTFFLAKTKTKEVKISLEHIGYQWLSYEQALEQIAFENAKKVLKKANEYLELE